MRTNFKNETSKALYEVLDAMKKDATRRIAMFKRGACNGYTISGTQKKEEQFRDKCLELKVKLAAGIELGKRDLNWLKKDQHDRQTMRLNLNDILGKDHEEIDNLIDMVFGVQPTARIIRMNG